MQADDRGMWPIDCIVDVGRGKARKVWAKVQWAWEGDVEDAWQKRKRKLVTSTRD